MMAAVWTRRGGQRRAVGTLLRSTLPVAAGLALVAATARYGLGLPAGHVVSLAGLLVLSGTVSLAVTGAAVWLLLGRQSGRLAVKLGLACALGPLVAAINVYFTAQAMLIKQADLGLLILLLAFSAAAGAAVAMAMARVLTTRLEVLARSAGHLGEGTASLPVPEGTDEVGVLGRALNELAERLRVSDTRRQESEEARRQLLAAVSHDLRTPLTSLRAVVEALSDGVVQDQQTTDAYLAGARHQVRQLERLIDDLFELARLDAGALDMQPAPLPAAALVEEAVECFRAEAERSSVRLGTEVESNLPPVLADGQRIGRVLLNLLSNALRYTPCGGRVVAGVSWYQESICLRVRDSGSGIEAADLPHVFDRFYRGEKSRSRRHGGAGLGLAIAQGIVEAHGGRIWAESRPGEGTTISFTLPVAARPLAAVHPLASHGTGADAGTTPPPVVLEGRGAQTVT